MIHPHTELRFINDEIGYGVVATDFIPKGTITWVLDKLDREFTPEEVNALDDTYKGILDTYSYRNKDGKFVLCWDNGRFVNHSFNSNCFTTAYDFEIAIRDIHPGEQLTDDYGYLNITEPFRAAPEGTRRKTVYPDDLMRYGHIWDKKLAGPFKLIPKVQQPLKRLLTEQQWDQILAVSNGFMPMQSLTSLYYSGNGVAGAH